MPAVPKQQQQVIKFEKKDELKDSKGIELRNKVKEGLDIIVKKQKQIVESVKKWMNLLLK